MPILVGLDGTGDDWFGSDDPSRNKHYDDQFANSFVKRICERQPGPNTMYLRGPGFAPANNGLINAIANATQFIRHKRFAGVNEPILLTGYSRGAAGVINIAKNLEGPPKKIDVEAMLLFDCVDRDLEIDADFIPANVGHVLHVERSEESRSRRSFGHSGEHPSPGSRTLYKSYKFTCTHGAMGGTPWVPEPQVSQGNFLVPGPLPDDFIVEGSGAFAVPDGKTNVTYAQDAMAAEQIQSFIKPFMHAHGFPIPPDFSYSSQLLNSDRSRAYLSRSRDLTNLRDFVATLPAEVK